MNTRTVRRLLTRTLIGACLLSAPALATWSIVVVDRATGEVCAAGATCLPSFPLRNRIPVVVVGKGAGCAQAMLDSGANRRKIFDGLIAGQTPEEILATLGQHQRQYGIVSMRHGALTFTGTGVGAARPGVSGEQGSLVYAIQGNVLAGDEVVEMAEDALLNTAGDLGQRVMAAMEAARAYGGDGRCSCNEPSPTDCGSPPMNFTKSAHTAFIVLARIGDEDGTCAAVGGCANGDYYLSRQFNGDTGDVDPVIELQSRYDQWRAARIGEVDHLLTEVQPAAPRLVADGLATLEVQVVLRDVDGNALATGGQTLHVRGIGGPQPAAVESVVDHGDGTHTITLRARTAPGKGCWRIVVDDGVARPTALHPPLEIDIDPLAELHAGFDRVSASEGAAVPLVVNAGAARAGRIYQVLAGASGTSPGSIFNDKLIPLNDDRLLRFTALRPGPPLFPGSVGVLDADGRASALLTPAPGLFLPFVGGRIDIVTVVFGLPDDVTNVVGFEVLP